MQKTKRWDGTGQTRTRHGQDRLGWMDGMGETLRDGRGWTRTICCATHTVERPKPPASRDGLWRLSTVLGRYHLLRAYLGPRAEVPSDSRDQGGPPDLQLYRPNIEPDNRPKQEAAGPLYDFPLC